MNLTVDPAPCIILLDNETEDDMKYNNQIYVVDYDNVQVGEQGSIVHTCDTIDQAGEWIDQHGVAVGREYTIDGTPEAWHEQTGECGGSLICDCA